MVGVPLSIISPSSSHAATTAPNPTDEDPGNPTTALLIAAPPSTSSSWTTVPRPRSAVVFTALVITTCVSLAAAFAFALLFFSRSSTASSSNPTPPRARPLSKLPHPVVLLVSTDGFRFGYERKTDTPNIHRLIANGTSAESGLIPVFPTLTFPNHYSIATGLYPSHHGIVNNHFIDPATGEKFWMGNHDPKWWLGEPIWETVVNHGLVAATQFWPGSDVAKGGWTCPERFCRKYDGGVPFEDRVDSVLGYFDQKEVPWFMTLYFEDPDKQGHKVGPDDPEITEAVSRIDQMIGRLIEGLDKRGVFEDVNIILVGDHGMVGTCDGKLIYLENLSPAVNISASWVQSSTPVLSIRPPPEAPTPAALVASMNEALKSGVVPNGAHLKMYLKEDLPARLHYSGSPRIAPVIGMLDEGYKVEMKRRGKGLECGGSHGYDNAFFSMRSVFIAHGPRFERARTVPSFENVQIYNLVTSVLGLKGAPNDGSVDFPEQILLPVH